MFWTLSSSWGLPKMASTSFGVIPTLISFRTGPVGALNAVRASPVGDEAGGLGGGASATPASEGAYSWAASSVENGLR